MGEERLPNLRMHLLHRGIIDPCKPACVRQGTFAIVAVSIGKRHLDAAAAVMQALRNCYPSSTATGW
jgi:hypothetical protein